jgi:hypothetical protein
MEKETTYIQSVLSITPIALLRTGMLAPLSSLTLFWHAKAKEQVSFVDVDDSDNLKRLC